MTLENTYAKYCPNVWLIKSQSEYKKGDIVEVNNKYGKAAECEIHNLVVKNANGYFYSYTRCDGINKQTYAEIKAQKYMQWASSATAKSNAFYEKSNEGKEFLSLGEPIKIGHHSEKKHRALIERNHARMSKSIEELNKSKALEYKAEYWKSQKNKIDLSMPESTDYFKFELEKAEEIQNGLKSGKIPKLHSYSLTYATKTVKDIKSKLEIANKLWG